MSKVVGLPGIPKNRVLAPKEVALFRTVLQLYETRQWKRGLKTADQILKKNPDHGETLSMRGLILTNLNRKEEGLECVKKGVRMDLTSHICWHVFGLVHKADRNYEEALKCYTQALKFEKDNLNILRDAAHLQMQLRHFDQLVETRQILLKNRSNVRQSWAAMAIAYHLNGQLESATKVLELYERTVKDIPPYDPEHSEFLLYHITILEEMGAHSEALNLLDISAKSRSITDRSMISIFRARLLHKLERSEEAREVWVSLIEGNTECYDHYKGYLSTQSLDLDSQDAGIRELAMVTLRRFAEQYPKAVAPRRILLKLSAGDEFKEIVEHYLLHGITRGIPSLFADIKDLYVSPEKREAIQDIVERIRTRPEQFSNLEGKSSEPPTTYIWTMYFLVQHYSSMPSTIPHALSLVDEAIAHTPTLPELYMAKARTLKRAGDPLGASATMGAAWGLDLQDRFLNTKYAKYLLRAGFIEEGNKTLGLFTKKGSPSPGADLEDMQSFLYMLEEGDAQNRAGRLNLALKRYHMAFKTFDDVEDDQYDFHSYAVRKYTFRTYLQFIKVEDRLRSHPAYAHAALAASKIYIRLFDNPKLASPTAGLTEAQKKAAKKAKKAELKQQEDAKKASQPAATDDSEVAVIKDDDPEGLKLLAAPDPLERAAKLLSPLQQLRPELLDTWLVSYEVAIRRKRYLQALRALNHAKSIDEDGPEVHSRVIELKTKVGALPSPLPVHIASVLESGLSDLIPEDQSLEVFNSAFLQQHSTSAPHILAAARGMMSVRGVDGPRADMEELVFQLTREEVQTDVPTSLQALSFLRDNLGSSRAEEFRAACDARFPLATVFRSEKELTAIRASRTSDFVQPSEDGDKSEELVM